MEYSPVACMRQSSRCCRSDSLGCLPRNFPLARAWPCPRGSACAHADEISANSVPLSRFKMRHCWLFQLLNLNKGNSLMRSHCSLIRSSTIHDDSWYVFWYNSPSPLLLERVFSLGQCVDGFCSESRPQTYCCIQRRVAILVHRLSLKESRNAE